MGIGRLSGRPWHAPVENHVIAFGKPQQPGISGRQSFVDRPSHGWCHAGERAAVVKGAGDDHEGQCDRGNSGLIRTTDRRTEGDRGTDSRIAQRRGRRRRARLIRRCLADNEMTVVTLTTEEEGIALLQGAWLGGAKGVLLMQSSGVGNCINMLSLSIMHRCPLPMLVTMRGDFGEFNPAQVPMGNATQTVLEAMGTLVHRADTPEDIAPTVNATIRLAFNTFRPTATLIGQRVLGAKTFGKD